MEEDGEEDRDGREVEDRVKKLSRDRDRERRWMRVGEEENWEEYGEDEEERLE